MKFKILILFVLLANNMEAQEVFSPTMVIVNSNELIISDDLKVEAKDYVKNGMTNEEKKDFKERNSAEGENFEIKSKYELKFLENQDIATQISFGLNYFLSYKFFEYFQQLLIYPIKESKNSNLEDLINISETHNVNWVVNISRIEIYSTDNQKKGKMNFQLYNQKTNEIVIDKEILTDDKNPGLEFTCQEGTIDCVINNSVSYMSYEILDFMRNHQDYWRD